VKSALWFLILLLPMALACSPISASKAISRADESLKAAQAIGGEAKCPYEFKAATLALEYAKDREGTSDFEAAIEFAKKARELAEEASRKASLIEDGNQARLDQGVTQ